MTGLYSISTWNATIILSVWYQWPKAGEIEQVVMQDWKRLRQDKHLLDSPAYQKHAGKPVVAVWGIGFHDDRAYTLDETHALLRFLHDNPEFGNLTVMTGVPWGWRTLDRDAAPDAKLHEVLQRWVVDIDLEKFFDKVNHDILMARVARRVRDKTLLRLIRRYLEAGMMHDGIVEARSEGTPQGGPLSPLLSNILLDDLDKELERRGHKFARYADDCNIYVKSKAAGERVLENVTSFVEKRLKLKVNANKSAVDRPWNRKFLGYSMTSNRQPKLKPAKASVEKMKGNVRELCRQGRGRNLQRFIQEDLNAKLRGWADYFRLSEVTGVFEELDGWVRRRIRSQQWRQWKRPRTRKKELIKHGIAAARAAESASNGRGPWWNAGASHMNEALPMGWFRQRRLIFIGERIQRYQKNLKTIS